MKPVSVGVRSPIEARVVLPPGHRVTRTFVDSATGYEVIEHVGLSEEAFLHVTLVDPRTGAIVPREQRAAEIPRDEKVRIDETHGFRLASRHAIDMRTGVEHVDEVLTDLRTGAELTRRYANALRPAGANEDLIAHYLAHGSREQQIETFWRDEYSRWSFEQRAAHWYENIWRRRRWQEEFGLDEFAMFTPANYAEWRTREPEIDRILDAVIDRFEDAKGIRPEINRRLGRTQVADRAPKKKPARRR